MFQIVDIIKSWDNFEKYSNAKKYLKSQGNKEEIIKYLKAINSLPLTWEDAITKLEQITKEDLDLMSNGLIRITGNVIISDIAVNGQCHQIAKSLKLANPEWKLYIGFCDTESLVSADWNLHSFCVDTEGNIIEPTNIERYRYFGIEVK